MRLGAMTSRKATRVFAVGALFGLGLVLVGFGYVDVKQIKKDVSLIERKLFKASRLGAKECAQQEFAEAEVHLTVAKMEMQKGSYWKAEGHVATALEKTRIALLLSRDCYADSDGDLILDKDDDCPYEIESYNGYLDDDGCPDDLPTRVILSHEKLIPLEPIIFDREQGRLDDTSYPVLEEIAMILRENGEMQLTIEGHTDSVGDEQALLTFSRRWAEATAEFLVAKGIHPQRVAAIGLGGTRPVASNATEVGQELNNRIEFFITQ